MKNLCRWDSAKTKRYFISDCFIFLTLYWLKFH